MPARLVRAKSLAARVVALIGPYCERIDIAGSVRREVATIHDIDIVCQSRPARPVFGDLASLQPALYGFIEHLPLEPCHPDWLAQCTCRSNKAGAGKRWRRLVIGGLHVDLWIVRPPAQYGTILFLRTGPERFTHTAVSARSVGGWRPRNIKFEGGAIRCRRDAKLDTWDVVSTPDEQDVFRVLGQPFVAPASR